MYKENSRSSAVPTREVVCAPWSIEGRDGNEVLRWREREDEGSKAGMTKRARDRRRREPYLISDGREKWS